MPDRRTRRQLLRVQVPARALPLCTCDPRLTSRAVLRCLAHPSRLDRECLDRGPCLDLVPVAPSASAMRYVLCAPRS
eukprot:1968959-Rhodomonas_salina.1